VIRIQVRHQVLGSKGQGHGDAKNVENSAQFWIIFNIDCKYLGYTAGTQTDIKH